MFGIKTACSLILALISVNSATPVAAESARILRESSTTAVTDITTSNVWWDLCLLYNGGKTQGFNALSSCVSSDRRFSEFQFIGAKPYMSDLYLYFYFDNDNSRGFTFKDDGTIAYAATISLAKKNGTSVTWSDPAAKRLWMIGTTYHVGTQFLAKFKVTSLFSDISIGATFDFAIGDFGSVSGSDYTKLYDVNAEQSFTYTNDHYDITSQVWGTKSTTVAMTDESARVMTVKEYTSGEWDALISHGLGSTVSSAGSGYYENHFVFYDLDRDVDDILAVDFYFTLVEFYVESLYHSTEQNLNFDPNVGASGPNDYYYNCPSSTEYVPGNALEKSYKGTKYETSFAQRYAYCYSLNSDGSTHTVDNDVRSSSWLPPFHTTYTRHMPQIINNYELSTVGDSATKNWISQYAKKSDGTSYKYSTCFAQTREEWTSEQSKTVENHLFGWPFGIVTSTDYYNLVKAHTSQGIMAGKMTVVVDGKILQWNVFSQSVNSLPSAPAEDHTVSFNEMLISFTKSNNTALITIAMIGFSLVAAFAVLGVTLLIANSGSQTVTVKTASSSKRGRKR